MGKYRANVKIKKERTRNNIKEPKYVSNSENEIRQFIIILIVILLIVFGIYLLTKLIVSKRESEPTNNTVATGSIDYNKVNVGMIFNRPYSEYYVMVFDSEDTNSAYYSSLLNNYLMFNGEIKVYYCDLSNSLNSKYVSKDDKGNSKAKSIDELSFSNITLLKIKDGKIASYIEDLEQIKNELAK